MSDSHFDAVDVVVDCGEDEDGYDDEQEDDDDVDDDDDDDDDG